ncbi:MAG: hypothetical protein P8J02_07760 [Yoonia sp.]|uniref:DUF6880 family protein n=1 Tax=Planktotalea sp. TaxID=2029877 RepID=UPI00261505C8|nr:DUF6880 family protein [Planktotalea sp.]MDG1084867.1 hypothetical protein [Planktotalea sp.]MDG1863083.1 hypothetical protein [Yoonia sp.]
MSKKTLNQTNLAALGAEQLAALLMEVSAGSADIKRRLRLELSYNLGAGELAHEVRKRLASLGKSVSYISWRKRKGLVKDLTTQLAMITDKIAPDSPTEAFELLWQFIEIAPPIYGRVDDSKGDVASVFDAARTHFTDIAPRAVIDPTALVDRIWTVIRDNEYGEWDGIITQLAPVLGTDGMQMLTKHLEAFADAPTTGRDTTHDAIAFLRNLRGDTSTAASRRARYVQKYMREIATASQDTQAYIAQFKDAELRRQDIAADIANRLLADGAAGDALARLNNADPTISAEGQDAWDAAYVATMTALGEIEDAQSHRWDCFARDLNPRYLRDYIKLLPDFEDIAAEERAREIVLVHPRFSTALMFCLAWPDLATAAQLITDRESEISGDPAAVLTQAAEALRSRHPRAAVMLWRAMIDHTLNRDLVFRFDAAVDHLANCDAVDAEIEDYGDMPDYDAYLMDLQTRHASKSAFWGKVK